MRRNVAVDCGEVESAMCHADLPLKGLRVLDFSRVLAGPYCTMLLADLGADVIKVEPPLTGDDTRGWGPPFVGDEATYFLAVNRGKRSCVINLRTEMGRKIAAKLAQSADVVVENFRPGTAYRLGIGYEQLRELNPGLVYCSISGFGSTREPIDRPAYDFIVQAESGLMSITGERTSQPTKVGVAIIDVLAGLNAGIGILAALNRRHETLVGGYVETSLLDSALSALVNQAQSALSTGTAPARLGNAHPSIVPYETFMARDAEVVIAAANDELFRRLCSILDLTELAEDRRFATNAARVANRDTLLPMLAGAIALHAVDDLLKNLAEAGVPSGRIHDVKEAFNRAAATGDGATIRVQHPTIGPLELVRTAVRLDSEPLASSQPPPLRGEDTREILLGLEYDEADVDALVAAGIVEARAKDAT